MHRLVLSHRAVWSSHTEAYVRLSHLLCLLRLQVRVLLLVHVVLRRHVTLNFLIRHQQLCSVGRHHRLPLTVWYRRLDQSAAPTVGAKKKSSRGCRIQR